jgi:uncharacterized protein (TIGR03435 family)
MQPIRSVSLLVFTSLVFTSAMVFGQPAEGHKEFEVASVRPAPINASGQEKVALGVHIDGSHLRIASFSLRDLIVRAYGVKAAQVTGPDWIPSERYDVNATLPAGSTGDDIPLMLQALLADRFKLKIHREKKEFPVYALILGKSPLKLTEDPLDPETADSKGAVNAAATGSAAGVSVNLGRGAYYTFADNQFEAKKMSVNQLCLQLERYVDRPIINMTDLNGTYDVTFKLTPEDYQAMLIRVAVNSGVVLPPQVLQYAEGNASSSLFDAIQQSGLKLDARKAPLDLIVVDRAQKTPTEN